MSVCEADRIDFVATRADSPVVKLVISDHLDWADCGEHCLLLQEKLNTYIAFIESGELYTLQEPPIPADPVVVISIATLHEPSAEGQQFLRRAADVLGSIGVALEVESRT